MPEPEVGVLWALLLALVLAKVTGNWYGDQVLAHFPVAAAPASVVTAAFLGWRLKRGLHRRREEFRAERERAEASERSRTKERLQMGPPHCNRKPPSRRPA